MTAHQGVMCGVAWWINLNITVKNVGKWAGVAYVSLILHKASLESVADILMHLYLLVVTDTSIHWGD